MEGNSTVEFDKEELKKKLTTIQYSVTQEKKTEPPFDGEYYLHFDKGAYNCIVCNEKLFDSSMKYESRTGWPSFNEAIDNTTEIEVDDRFGRPKREVHCKKCKAHLGHIFEDGKSKTGYRYCVNSVSLNFQKHQGS